MAAASNVPDTLKKLDINRFVHRAAQLEKLKPVVSYWAYYRAVQQIIKSGLQTRSDECRQYTTVLMDKLEQLGTEHAAEDAIKDDVTAAAYIEKFALDTFQRADNAVRANKASRQTADTFQASATFLDLLQVWHEPTPEVAAKVKFAKFHALRIVKAIKAGEDPNDSNPVQEENEAVDVVPLDPGDPEVQLINGTASLQPSVEDAPEDTSSAVHVSPVDGTRGSGIRSDHVAAPTGGDYFPEASEQALPATSPIETPHNGPKMSPSLPPTASTPSDPQDFYQAPPPKPQPTAFSPAAAAPMRNPPIPVAPPPAVSAQPMNTGELITDDVAVAEAQKHAKWAISALNFEDVPTAVNELRAALRSLGAS